MARVDDASEISMATQMRAGLRVLFKSVGETFERKPTLNDFPLVILLTFILMAIFTFSFSTILYVVKDWLQYNRSLFNFADKLTLADVSFKSAMRIYTSGFHLVDTLVLTEVWKDSLPAASIAKRVNESKLASDSNRIATGTTNFMDTFVLDIRATLNLLEKSTEDVAVVETIGGAEDIIQKEIFQVRIEVEEYDWLTGEHGEENDLSMVTFLRNLYNRLKKFILIIEDLKIYMNGKEPPFNIEPVLKQIDYKGQAELRLGYVRTLFEDIFEFYQKRVKKLRELLSGEHLDKTKNSVLVFMYVSLGLFLLYFVILLFFAKKLSMSLFRTLSVYKHLRHDEIVIQKETISMWLRFYKLRKLDEAKVVWHYQDLCNTASVYNKLVQGVFGKPHGKNSLDTQRRRVKIKHNLWLGSSTLMIFLAFFQITIVLGFLALVLTLVNRIETTVKKMDFFLDTYQKFATTENYYFYSSVFSIYGNFIKIEDHDPDYELAKFEGENNPYSIIMTQLISSRRLYPYYFGQNAAAMDEMMFKDACSGLSKDLVNYKRSYELCKENMPTSKGFVSYLGYERDFIKSKVDMVYANTTFLNASHTDWLILPYQSSYFSEEYVRIRYLHKSLFQSSLIKVINYFSSSINQDITEEFSLFWNWNVALPVSTLFVYLCLFFIANLYILKRTLMVCSESIRNILPEVIHQNKLVYNEYKYTYAKRY